MNPRDFLTTAAVGLVLVVGGLAIADSLRGCNDSDRRVAPTTTQAATTVADPVEGRQLDAPEGWPTGVLDGVLTFVDADSCQLRRIGLTPGRERPIQPFQTDCAGLWAPKVGARVAFTPRIPAGRSIRLADLGQSDRDYGVYPLLDGSGAIWSFDAQRAAWCDDLETGIERVILGEARNLSFCPLAYTPEGELAHARGNRLVAGPRTVLTASGPIAFAQFGTDGSALVRVGRTLERHAGDAPPVSVRLPDFWTGAEPIVSPDTCLSAVLLDHGIFVFSLCGSKQRLGETDGFVAGFPDGYAATWSPDGQWLAIAEEEGIGIVFHRLVGPDQALRWPADATQLAWSTS